MQNSIFTRSLATHLDEALIDSVHYQGQTWRQLQRQWTTDSRRQASDGEPVYYFRCNNGEFFTMNAVDTKELRRMSDALSAVSGNYTSMAMYLWLVTHGKLEQFFNNLTEKLNADTQTA